MIQFVDSLGVNKIYILEVSGQCNTDKAQSCCFYDCNYIKILMFDVFETNLLMIFLFTTYHITFGCQINAQEVPSHLSLAHKYIPFVFFGQPPPIMIAQ